MKKVRLTLLAFLAIASTRTVSAQNVLTIEEDSGKVETIDLPEGMIINEEELNEDYNIKNNLTPGSGTARELSADDSVYIARLAKIPTTIEMPLNDVTRKFIEKYISMKSSVATMLGASNFYFPIFEEALERHGVPLELRYLPVIESALRPSSTSNVGAAGLWQFMPATGKKYGLEINTLVDERRDTYKASEAAATYLAKLYDMFGDWGLAIAAYNCGEGGVKKALARSGNKEHADYWTIYNKLPHETRGYVPAFIAATYIMNYYCEHGIVPKEATLPNPSDTVDVRRELSFSKISSHCNISVDELRSLNPQYRKDIVPAGYTLLLPAEKVNTYLAYEDSLCSAVNESTLNSSEERRAVTEDLNSDSKSKKEKKEKVSRSRKEKEEAKDNDDNDDDSKAEKKESRRESSKSKKEEKTTKKDKKEKDDKKSSKKDKDKDEKTSKKDKKSKKDKDKDKDDKKSSKKDKDKKEKKGKSEKSHTIQSGETLSGIAERNHTTVDKLKKLNGLKDDNIRAGKTLKVK